MHDLRTLEERVSKLEDLTTGEDGYMLISVPIGSYILPPKEVEKITEPFHCVSSSALIDRKHGVDWTDKLFTKKDMIDFAQYCLEAPFGITSVQLEKWTKSK